MTTKIDPLLLFTVPITVINHNHSNVRHDTFMESICYDMTINEVIEHFVKLYNEEEGIDYSGRNINIVIEGKNTNGEEKCEHYDIDSGTCLEFNIN